MTGLVAPMFFHAKRKIVEAEIGEMRAEEHDFAAVVEKDPRHLGADDFLHF